VSYLALGSLEGFAPPLQRLPGDAQAIVVAGGYAESVSDAGTEFAPGHDTLGRCVRAPELYRQGHDRTVLVSPSGPAECASRTTGHAYGGRLARQLP
jgi:hypothetical protein